MKYSVDKLKEFVEKVMIKAGLSKEESYIFSDSLISAEIRGVASHGLTRLSTYAQRVKKGLVANNVEIKILNDGGSVVRIDGQNGMGAYVGTKTMELCIERAKTYGSAFATVCGGNHFGCACYFTMLAAQNDMIGFAVANGPSAIPPTGSKQPLLGTNPVSIAIPAKTMQPLVLDFATSSVARGKVALAKKRGEKVPEGWGLDADGQPTTDPAKILDGGSMLPMAGAKGYGIALIVEILASCLSGALNGQTMGSFYDFNKVQNSGFAFGAIDISKIIDVDIFKNSVDMLFTDMKNASRIDANKEIMIPGEIEYLKSISTIKEGISLSPVVEKELMETAELFQVEFPVN